MSACRECGCKIGWLREWRGARYCSDEHRVRALAYERVLSATATVGERETPKLSAAETALNALARARSCHAGTSRYTIAFVVGLLLAVSVGLTGLSALRVIEGSGKALETQVRSQAGIRLFEDFRGRLDGWTPVAARLGRGDWKLEHGFLRPGALRLWADTTHLTDYQLNFVGQIRERALNWVVRASGAENYVACRLEVTRAGPLPIVDFVRFSRTEAGPSKAVRRPLPMTVRPDTRYEVTTKVRGSDFVAMVNGQVVDAWTDAQHLRGAVGFWLDKDEAASIRWARVNDRDDLTSRLLGDLLQPADQK